jgi:hypothetical protein
MIITTEPNIYTDDLDTVAVRISWQSNQVSNSPVSCRGWGGHRTSERSLLTKASPRFPREFHTLRVRGMQARSAMNCWTDQSQLIICQFQPRLGDGIIESLWLTFRQRPSMYEPNLLCHSPTSISSSLIWIAVPAPNRFFCILPVNCILSSTIVGPTGSHLASKLMESCTRIVKDTALLSQSQADH